MDTYRLKSGTNRNQRRLWIEGTRLLDAGLTKGTALYRTMHDDGTMTLSTAKVTRRDGEPAAKRHTIAGKGTGHPVLDLCGKWVTAFMGDHTHFEVETWTRGADERVTTDLIITPVTH